MTATTASFHSSGSLPRATKAPLPSRATSSSTMGPAGTGMPGKLRRLLGPRAWGRARAKRRSAASLIPIILAPSLDPARRDPQGDECPDPGLGRAPHKALDAGLLARGHRPAASDARRP